jgi:hypothetical protein
METTMAKTTVTSGASVGTAPGYPAWTVSAIAQMPAMVSATPGAANTPTAGTPINPELVCSSATASSLLTH